MRQARPDRRLALLLVMGLIVSGCSVHRLDNDQLSTGTGAPRADTSGDTSSTDATSAPTDDGTSTGSSETTTPTNGTTGDTDTGDRGGAQGSSTTAAVSPPATNAPQGGPQSVPRTASDRGITENEIRLGILHTSDSFFAATGSSTKSVDRLIAPFISEINDAGGINGRTVVPKVSTYDPLSADSMNAACVQQAEDHKVFASIAQIGFYGDAEICMSVKETPLLTGNNSSRKTNVERERGWVRQTHQNKDRNAINWIDWMIGSGILDASTRTGLIFVDVPEDRDLVDNVVLPYFDQKGLPRPRLATLSPSIAQTPSEAQTAVLQFKSNNVDLVLPLISFLRILMFAEQASAAQYFPDYTVSDFGLLATDAMAGMPPDQWAGVRGITVMRTGLEDANGYPTGPAFAECYDVYRRYGEDFEPSSDDPSRPDPIEVGQMMHYCQHVVLWADAARRAGPNPTRASFLQAIDNTGTWSHRVVMSERLTYGPNKFDGADLFQVVEWQPDCNSSGGCYRPVEGFRAGA